MATLRSHTSAHTKAHPINTPYCHLELKNNQVAETYKIPKSLMNSIKQQLENYKVNESALSKDAAFIGMHGDMPEWAVNLKGLRAREGLTQVEMAQQLDITQSNLSAYENGRRAIGKNMAKKIASVFKVNYQLFL